MEDDGDQTPKSAACANPSSPMNVDDGSPIGREENASALSLRPPTELEVPQEDVELEGARNTLEFETI